MDGLNNIDDYRFPVEMIDLMAVKEIQDGWKTKEYPVQPSMARAVVRTDTGAVLGIHSGKYNLVSHESIVENIMEGVALANISKDYDHQVTVYEDGAKLKGSFIFNDLIQKDPEVNDIIRFKVDYMNSYDGMWSIMVNAYGERLWCLNGCTSPEKVTQEKNRHTSGFNIEASATQITQALEVFFNDRERWDAWRKTKTTNDQVIDMFKRTLAKPTTPTLTNDVNWKQLTRLTSNYHQERNVLGNNKWAAYNAATDWATHPENVPNPHRVVVRRQDAVQKMLNSKAWEELV
jgi:hypothetical protein